MDLHEVSHDEVQLLIDVVYNGMVEGTIEELRGIVLLARHLEIAIPVSAELLKMLDVPPAPPQRVRKPVMQEQQARTGKKRPSENPLPPPLKRIKEGKRCPCSYTYSYSYTGA